MKRTVVAHDKMQRGYVYYRTEPFGRNFAPGFEPQLTPKQMLRLGVFGGKYMTDCRGEIPRSTAQASESRPTRAGSSPTGDQQLVHRIGRGVRLARCS